jgi:hypothetical protein
MQYQLLDGRLINRDSPNFEIASFFDLKTNQALLDLDVYLADSLPHFKMITADGVLIWHFIADYKSELVFLGFSGNCSTVQSEPLSDYEEI